MTAILIGILVGGIIFFLYINLWQRWAINKHISLAEKGVRKGILCEHTMEIDSQGLREITSVNNSFESWETISSIEQDSKYIYVYVQLKGVHTIPKRCFSSEQEASDFFLQAFNYWRTAVHK